MHESLQQIWKMMGLGLQSQTLSDQPLSIFFTRVPKNRVGLSDLHTFPIAIGYKNGMNILEMNS